MRNAQWTPEVELAPPVELRVEHVLLEPGRPVPLSLARLFPVAVSAGEKLTASVLVPPTASETQPSRELMRTVVIELTRIPFSTQVQIPEMTPGNYDLTVRLAPAGAAVPKMLEDVFTKIIPVHIEKLEAEAPALRAIFLPR